MDAFIYAIVANIIIWFWILLVTIFLSNFQKQVTSHLSLVTSLTVWVILGIVFLDFLPESIEWMNIIYLWPVLLLWILTFYVFEIFLHWHHCHDIKKDAQHFHDHNTGLMTFWTLLHNFFHWVVVYSAFLLSVEAWVSLTLWIFLHALPQNISNYFMNHSKLKSLYLASFAWVFWVFLSYPFWVYLEIYKYFLLTFVTGGLLYIALADILPTVNVKNDIKTKTIHFWMVLLGISLFFLLELVI